MGRKVIVNKDAAGKFAQVSRVVANHFPHVVVAVLWDSAMTYAVAPLMHQKLAMAFANLAVGGRWHRVLIAKGTHLTHVAEVVHWAKNMIGDASKYPCNPYCMNILQLLQ